MLKFFRKHKELRDIGCFDAQPTKYSNDRTFEALQTIHLGKYESSSLLKRMLISIVHACSILIGLFILIESIRALLFLF